MTLKPSELKPSTKPLKRSGFVRQQQALRRASTLARTAPLAPVGKRRKAERVAWEELSAFVLARDGGCAVAARWPEIRRCWGTLVAHHIDPTGQGWPKLCDPDRLIATCTAHHTGPGGIHGGGQTLARARGLLR